MSIKDRIDVALALHTLIKKNLTQTSTENYTVMVLGNMITRNVTKILIRYQRLTLMLKH